MEEWVVEALKNNPLTDEDAKVIAEKVCKEKREFEEDVIVYKR